MRMDWQEPVKHDELKPRQLLLVETLDVEQSVALE
jgi:hypothetical protein